MYNYSVIAQIIVALGVGFVWIFRLDNIIVEFKQYGINDQTRTLVGASKIILATLLIVGIWYPTVWLVTIPALLMAFLMLSAQYFHFKAKNPFIKRVPSLFLLLLCLFIAAVSLKII